MCRSVALLFSSALQRCFDKRRILAAGPEVPDSMDGSASVPQRRSAGGLAAFARIVWAEVAALRRGRTGIAANLFLPALLLVAVAAGFGGSSGGF